MKKLKKLSLENEMKKEAEQIEKKVREDRSLDDIAVSDEMEKELFNKIQDYEYDKRHKKVIHKKKKSKLVPVWGVSRIGRRCGIKRQGMRLCLM